MKKSTLYTKRNKMNSRLMRRASAIDNVIYIYMNMITTEEEIAQSVYIFKRLLLVHEEYHSFLDKPDPYNDDE